jgi:Ca2+-binding EF-hand superfamily protein
MQHETMEIKIFKFQADYSIAVYEVDRYREAFNILDLNESGNIDIASLLGIATEVKKMFGRSVSTF